MGFYGNISNTSKTQFQFDKIYSNRREMDSQVLTDGIYIGRYVLVEYDNEHHLDTFLRVVMENGKAYYNSTGSAAKGQLLTKSLIDEGEIVYSSDSILTPANGLTPKNCIFYKCTSKKIANSSAAATFERITALSSDASNYIRNYHIDLTAYKADRGYDSTVWQKVYTDNKEKYVMIAELNTVVPTFDVSPDAPSVCPIIPHFDTRSTDVYYKLHWQAPWGMRVAAASGYSDESTTWLREVYNQETGITTTQYYNGTSWVNLNGGTTQEDLDLAAAIFYNNAGFDAVKSTHISGPIDEIQIRPTGRSGNKYNAHNGSDILVEKEDIQEISIILPSIGNAIASVWDVLYGVNENNEKKRYRDIEWKDAVNIEKDTVNGNAQDDTKGGMTRSLSTVAGCINSVHDLMGMIITDKNNNYLNETWFNKNYIYKDGNSYYRIHKYPLYTEIIMPTLPSASAAPSDQEYNVAYENVINEILQTYGDDQYYILKEKNGNNWNVELLNHQAISKLEEGDMIGVKNGQYGYEFIEIESLAQNLGTIYGCILQMKNLLEVEDSETRDQTTVTGAINALNDIIKVFEHLVPGEFLICDSEGHVNSANWTTEQPFSYYNHNVLAPQEIKVAKQNFNPQTNENRWISLSLDEANRKIELKHIFNKIKDTVTTADKNDSSKGDGINKPASTNIDDTIKLYTPIVDAMGHVVGKNIETITLPYGYKTIKAVNTEATTAPTTTIASNGQSADNTQDTLTFTAANKWIKFDNNTDDTVKVGHLLSPFATGTNANTLYGLTANQTVAQLDVDNTFEVPCLQFDEAGHILEARTHTVTLPENFTKHTTTLSDVTNVDSTVGTAGTIIPDTLTDTLTFAEGNRWINLAADATNDKLTISHYVKNFTESESPLDFNNTANGKTFTVQSIGWDRAGHLISSDKKTFTLPDNFKTLTINNTGNTAVSFGTATDGSIVADTLVDTATFDIGNRWLAYVANADSDKVTLYHTAPDENSVSQNTTQTGNETPNFGGTFLIPEVKYDEAGHIFKVGTHTVTVPQGSLNDTTAKDDTANVLTAIGFTSTTGEIYTEHNNVANLLLTDLTAINESDAWVQSTDDIKGAFNKVDTRLDNEITRAQGEESKLNNEIKDANECIDILNGTTETEGSVAYSIKQAIDTEVNDRNTAIEDAINLLDVTDNAIEGQYVSAVNEVDGKIQVSRTALPAYTLTTGTINGAVRFNDIDVAVNGLKSAAYREEIYFVPKAQYDLDMETKDAQIKGLNTEAKRLTNEVNALREELKSLYEIVKQLHPEVFETE